MKGVINIFQEVGGVQQSCVFKIKVLVFIKRFIHGVIPLDQKTEYRTVKLRELKRCTSENGIVL